MLQVVIFLQFKALFLLKLFVLGRFLTDIKIIAIGVKELDSNYVVLLICPYVDCNNFEFLEDFVVVFDCFFIVELYLTL